LRNVKLQSSGRAATAAEGVPLSYCETTRVSGCFWVVVPSDAIT
jgi:hypothetical protein